MDHALNFIDNLIVEKGGDFDFNGKLLDQSEEEIVHNMDEVRKEMKSRHVQGATVKSATAAPSTGQDPLVEASRAKTAALQIKSNSTALNDTFTSKTSNVIDKGKEAYKLKVALRKQREIAAS